MTEVVCGLAKKAGVKVHPAPNPPRFTTYSFTETGDMIPKTSVKEKLSAKLPVSGRRLDTMHASMMLEDDPWSSDDDDEGVNAAIVDMTELEEFASVKLGEPVPLEWCSELSTLMNYKSINKPELFGLMQTLKLTGLEITDIDPSATMMTNLRTLDISSNSLKRVENLTDGLVSLAAYNNEITGERVLDD